MRKRRRGRRRRERARAEGVPEEKGEASHGSYSADRSATRVISRECRAIDSIGCEFEKRSAVGANAQRRQEGSHEVVRDVRVSIESRSGRNHGERGK